MVLLLLQAITTVEAENSGEITVCAISLFMALVSVPDGVSTWVFSSQAAVFELAIFLVKSFFQLVIYW